MNWFERLQFYTKDFTKEETIQLVRYIKWVKAEGIIQDGKEIEELIDKDTTKRTDHPIK